MMTAGARRFTAVHALGGASEGHHHAARLLPDALWVPTAEPGYPLCMATRREADRYRRRHAREPGVILMRHQGLVVAGDTPARIRERMHETMAAVAGAIRRAHIPPTLRVGPDPDAETVGPVFDLLHDLAGEEASALIPSGPFRVARGALSPDHIVYSRARLYEGEVTAEALRAFRAGCGHWPWVIATPMAAYGVGRTHKAATLALEYAKNAALIVQYAEAFGGATYLPDDVVAFVEQWAAELYRRRPPGG